MILRSLRHCTMTGFALISLQLMLISGCKESAPQTDATIQSAPSVGFILTAPTSIPLNSNGYIAREYFFQGVAKSYVSDYPLTSDGHWSVRESSNAADYKSRMIVYRPVDPEQFNGTVIVEWMNVSAGIDTPTEWVEMHDELMRQGYAYVGISAQYVGVEGGENPVPSALPISICLALKCVLPARYRTLHHPGDSFSYDIYRQAANLIRNPAELNPLGDLIPQRLIAAGQSQSAHRLMTYLNALELPNAGLFDGYFIHSRLGSAALTLGGGGSAPLSQAPELDIVPPDSVLVRDDLSVPVFEFQTETDQIAVNAYLSRQLDSPLFRLWEVAGAAHADLYVSKIGLTDSGQNIRAASIEITDKANPFLPGCEDSVNSAPQHHYAVKAAMRALNRWVVEGIEPPSFPRLEINDSLDGYKVDQFGNALGGVRSPWVDVPIALLSGLNDAPQLATGLCVLYGKTEMLQDDLLYSMYPTHQSYVEQFAEATNAAVAAGVLLPEHVPIILSAAEAADIPPGHSD